MATRLPVRIVVFIQLICMVVAVAFIAHCDFPLGVSLPKACGEGGLSICSLLVASIGN